MYKEIRECKVNIKNKDIYDKFGRMYIKKGTTITLNKNNINTLIKLDLLEDVLNELENGMMNYEKWSSENIKINLKKDARYRLKKIENKFIDSYTILDDEIFQIAVIRIHIVMTKIKETQCYMYINTLANYAEWYYSHSINTTIIATMISIKLGYNDELLESIIIGAMLHDIGMILIPKNIIDVDKVLDDKELKIKEKHCELGLAMIEDLDIPEKSKNIIMQHHEKIDGKGYPMGLSGDELDEETIIVIIADSCDYKTSKSIHNNEKSLKEIIYEIIIGNEKYSNKIIDAVNKIIDIEDC